jgi:hypothetical protein
MKIFKYISLLLLLVFIATSIFVATLDPDYKIVRTKTINAKKTEVFSYLNDYKNWSEFGIWNKNDQNIKISFSKKNIGIGSFYAWKGKNEEVKFTTLNIYKNDSIHQKMNFNDVDSDVYWSFTETNGKTKIIWKNIGKMSFFSKIFSATQGGIDLVIGNVFEKSLNNIEKNLKKNIDLHSITSDGLVEITMGMHLQKTINSKNENLDKNIKIMISNLMKYMKNNKIVALGKPFVKYFSENDLKQTTYFSVCSQIKDSVFTDSKNEYQFKNMLPFQAIKTTLKGNLIYKNEAKSRAYELMLEYNLIRKIEKPIIEVYKINIDNDKNINNWITEIYVPVKKKDFSKKFYKPKINSVTSNPIETKNQSQPTTTNVVPEKIIIKKDFPQ